MILLVEDEIPVAAVEEAKLRKLGYEVLLAATGEDAAEKIGGGSAIDLVLMDVDRVETARRMLGGRDIPIVLLVRRADPDILAKTETIDSYGVVEVDSSPAVLDAAIGGALRLFAGNRSLWEKNRGLEAFLGALPEHLFVKDVDGQFKSFEKGASSPLVLTERKTAEDVLARSRTLLAKMSEIAKIGGWRVDLETNRLEWTEECYVIYELDPGSFVPTLDNAVKFPTQESRDVLEGAIRRMMETGEEIDVELEIVTAKGNRKWIRNIGQVEYGGGRAVARTGVMQDISKQKLSENALNRTTILLSTILESPSDVTVFALDKDYRYIEFNSNHKKRIREFFGADICLGANMLDFMSPGDDREAAKANFDRALGGEQFTVVGEFGDEEDSRVYWLNYFSPLVDAAGCVIGLTCFGLNQTEQKRMGNRVSRLLAEKETLLKEVHHRIKNNMNTMISLLNLQANSVKNSIAAAALLDAQTRFRSMQVLYDKLYRNEAFEVMPLDEYLPELVKEILRIHPNEAIVRSVVDVDGIPLEVKTLSAVGIIVNEIISNSMKYAFKGRSGGTITVIAKGDGNFVSMVVSDDGVGIPPSVDFDNSTGFGLISLKALMHQLDGRIRLEREGETRFVLEFPVK